MALNFLAPEIAIPVAAAAQGAKGALGEQGFNNAKSSATLGYGLLQGFVPLFNPIFLIPQMALFIFMIIFYIVFLGWIGVSRWWSIPAAYFTQAFIVAFTLQYVLKTGLAVGFGI